ncbi:cytosol aminopeptidase-like [Adelges cooleyi]|uniref:cytosol aminopeptidase-like n=1 Tax=Adelges cooleyi TaxID=133065 RepID=UPI0021808D14|nr:cytosol aminopeptidase-like [Adelges cooleyi]XP_050444045.1 cytosol aminopeptidase-like [Adelges cooleyi]
MHVRSIVTRKTTLPPVVGPCTKYEKPEERYTCTGAETNSRGIVLGVYEPQKAANNFIQINFTRSSQAYNTVVCGKLSDQLKRNKIPVLGEAAIYNDLDVSAALVALVGLGSEHAGYDLVRKYCRKKENTRIAAGVGTKELQDRGISQVFIEEMDDFQSAFEGAILASYNNDEQKKDCDKEIPHFSTAGFATCYLDDKSSICLGDMDNLQKDKATLGMLYAETQNFVRRLMTVPTNVMNPEYFVHEAIKVQNKVKAISVTTLPEKTLTELNMNGILALCAGSCQPAKFLDISYNGCACTETPPVVLVGQGVTYASDDCHAARNPQLRGQTHIGGGAIVLSVIKTLAEMGAPINVRGLIPLFEITNGICPGDVIVSADKTSIEVTLPKRFNTLALMDALQFARTLKPHSIVSLANTPGVGPMEYGSRATQVWCNDEAIWETFKSSSAHTGDIVHRYPLDSQYDPYIQGQCENRWKNASDIDPLCTDARILSKFVGYEIPWIHMELQYVNYEPHRIPYLRQNTIPGRPTRTVLEGLLEMIRETRQQ